MLDFLARVDPACIRAVLPTGTPEQVARTVKGFVDVGLRVPKILDYGGMAGLDFAARSPAKVRAVEDELMRLCGMSNDIAIDTANRTATQGAMALPIVASAAETVQAVAR